jgi:hypothetical protein
LREWWVSWMSEAGSLKTGCCCCFETEARREAKFRPGGRIEGGGPWGTTAAGGGGGGATEPMGGAEDEVAPTGVGGGSRPDCRSIASNAVGS